MTMNRQSLMLGLLALAVVWALWFYLGGESPLVGGGTGRAVQSREIVGALPPVIRLTDLENPAAEFNPSGGRNLFAYAEDRRVAVAGPKGRANRKTGKAKSSPPPVAPKPVVPPPPPARETASAQPTPPEVNFKFVGYLGPQDALIGVFRVNTPDGEEVVLAAVGETLAENFRVYRIGYEEVEIGYTEAPFLNERKVLPMGGQS